jgi:hypothetical protein
MTPIGLTSSFSSVSVNQSSSSLIASIYKEPVKLEKMPLLIQGVENLLQRLKNQQDYGPTDRKLIAHLLLEGADGMLDAYKGNNPRDRVKVIEYADKLRRLIDDAVKFDPAITKERYKIYATGKELNCIDYAKSLLRQMPTYMG